LIGKIVIMNNLNLVWPFCDVQSFFFFSSKYHVERRVLMEMEWNKENENVFSLFYSIYQSTLDYVPEIQKNNTEESNKNLNKTR